MAAIGTTDNKGTTLGKAVGAGVVGTVALTALTVVAGLMGLRMDIPAMLSGFMGVPLLMGWLTHFAIGIVLALGYALLFVERLPGAPAVRGALYGLVPFFMAQLIVMPMMGMGFFTLNAPNAGMLVLGSLVGHLVYGAVVGAIYGLPETD